MNVLNKGKTVLPQLAERLLLTPDDPGSNPVFGTWIGHFFAFKEKTKVFNVYLSLPFLKKWQKTYKIYTGLFVNNFCSVKGINLKDENKEKKTKREQQRGVNIKKKEE